MDAEEKKKKEQAHITEQYKKKGAQQFSLEEYLALQKKKKKPALKLPAPLQFILATPLLIVFCFGIFFLPYVLYLIFSSPTVDSHLLDNRVDKQVTTK